VLRDEAHVPHCTSLFVEHLFTGNITGNFICEQELASQIHDFGFVLLWICSMMLFHIVLLGQNGRTGFHHSLSIFSKKSLLLVVCC
jgi:hypothetical protein